MLSSKLKKSCYLISNTKENSSHCLVPTVTKKRTIMMQEKPRVMFILELVLVAAFCLTDSKVNS